MKNKNDSFEKINKDAQILGKTQMIKGNSREIERCHQNGNIGHS